MGARGLRERGPVERPASLDDLDGKIIMALQEDGRARFRGLAARLGCSEATIRNRYGRLVDSGVLEVTAVTNPLGMGYDAMAMLGVTVEGSSERVADELATWQEAIYVVVVAGRFDVLVEVQCADDARFFDLLNNTIRTLPEVVATETFVYLKLHKQTYPWPP